MDISYFKAGQWNDSYSVIIFFTLFIFLFAFIDARSFRSNHHKDYKTIIVSTGILGTFVGIFWGLWNFDTTNIGLSVPQLLDGLKVAFITSIIGMASSIILAASQKLKGGSGESEIEVLESINSKLSPLNRLEAIEQSTSGLLSQTRNWQEEAHRAQSMLQAFLEKEFQKTNNALETAIEKLSEGATQEIIEALNKVITNFNDNLKEQFGEHFSRLNDSVVKLIEWQENYKSTIEKSETLLHAIQDSLNQSKDTFESVASRNHETADIYEKLKHIIETYQSQVNTLNGQLKAYSRLTGKAEKAFEKAGNTFSVVSDNVSQLSEKIDGSLNEQSSSLQRQSDVLTKLTAEIEKQLPESLGQLERTLTGLTEKFAEDYERFLERVSDLTARQ